ncbi:MAG: hypothetical protein AAB421_04780 [Patescibacteria group bacterium]
MKATTVRVFERACIAVATIALGGVLTRFALSQADYLLIQETPTMAFLFALAVASLGFTAFWIAHSRSLGWILTLPLSCVATAYLLLIGFYTHQSVREHDALVHTNGTVAYPFKNMHTRQSGWIIVGQQYYRVVRAVRTEHELSELTVSVAFTDEVIRAWRKDKPLVSATYDINHEIFELVNKEKRSARLALLKNDGESLRKLYCEAGAKAYATSMCPFSQITFHFGRRYYGQSDLWSDQYTVPEVINEKMGSVAAKFLVGNRYNLKVDEAEQLLKVVVEDTSVSAYDLYKVLARMSHLSDAARAPMWDALYLRTDAACVLLTVMQEMVGLTDADRERIRSAVKKTNHPGCARRALDYKSTMAAMAIPLTDTERNALRIVIARGVDTALVDRMLAEGKSIDEVEREAAIVRLITGEIRDIEHELRYNRVKLTPVERRRVLARVLELRETDFQKGRYAPISILSGKILAESERTELMDALKMRIRTEPSLLSGVVWALTGVDDGGKALQGVLALALEFPAIHSAKILEGMAPRFSDLQNERNKLYDHIIASGDKMACSIVVRIRYDSYYRYSPSAERLAGLKKCSL